jgi:hypothetical protein
MQLAGDAPTQALQRHYLEMAETWTALAQRDLDDDGQIQDRGQDSHLRRA